MILKITKSIFLFAIVLISCKNKYIPTSSKLNATINGTISTEIIDNTYFIDLEENERQKGYLQLFANHYTNDKINNKWGFSWDTGKVNTVTKTKNEVGIPLDNISELGTHIIHAKSEYSEKFDKKFVIYVHSSLNSFQVTYNLINKKSDIDYKDCISGVIYDNTSTIDLATNSEYEFSVSSAEGAKIGMVNFYSSCDDIAYWKGNQSDKRILCTSYNHQDGELNLEIVAGISNIKKSIKVKLHNFIKVEIEENENSQEPQNSISIQPNEKKQFSINIKGTNTGNELLSCSVSNSTTPPTDNWTNFYIGDTSLTMKNENISFFTVIINSQTKKFEILGINETYDKNTLKNIPCYIHFRDNFNNYLGCWRVYVGGTIESITLNTNKIDIQVQKSFTVKATTLPNNTNCDLIWYLSVENEKNVNNKKIPPQPIDIFDYTSAAVAINSSNKIPEYNIKIYKDEGTTTNIKQFNMTFENGKYKIADSNRSIAYDVNTASYPDPNIEIYESEEDGPIIFKTLAFHPDCKNGESVLNFLAGSTSSTYYLTCYDLISSFYKTIPLHITGEGEIVLKSFTPVPADNKTKNIIYSKNMYENENNTNTSSITQENIKDKFASYSVQEYPQTARENTWGTNTRTFYFPHSSRSQISIDNYTSSSSEILLNPYSDSEGLFTIKTNKSPSGWTLDITPRWVDEWENAKKYSLPSPPKNFLENPEEFDKYVGVGNVEFIISSLQGLLRIVIYQANNI